MGANLAKGGNAILEALPGTQVCFQYTYFFKNIFNW